MTRRQNRGGCSSPPLLVDDEHRPPSSSRRRCSDDVTACGLRHRGSQGQTRGGARTTSPCPASRASCSSRRLTRGLPPAAASECSAGAIVLPEQCELRRLRRWVEAERRRHTPRGRHGRAAPAARSHPLALHLTPSRRLPKNVRVLLPTAGPHPIGATPCHGRAYASSCGGSASLGSTTCGPRPSCRRRRCVPEFGTVE